MLFAPLCSSSAANSSYIGSESGGFLVDAGCTYKSLLNCLLVCGLDISRVKAVLITHEHIDHIRGLKQLTKHNDIPVYASRGTCEFLLANGHIHKEENLFELSGLGCFPADYDIDAFYTPHDSAQSVGYSICAANGYKLAYMTDLGEVTPEVREGTRGSDFVFIEANYDPDTLRQNTKYPSYIKERIASSRGHLSNYDSAVYISELIKNGATRIVLGHLSKENNTPQLAYANTVNALAAGGFKLNRDYTLDVAGVQTCGERVAI